MPRPQISVTIISFNEEENIHRAIESVKWANEVLLIDSGSTDRTVEIAKGLGAKVISNPWPGYGQQKNFAQQNAKNDWVLNIDADEVVSTDLAEEIQDTLAKISEGELHSQGFYFPRKTFYLGKWIRYGGWYPNYLVRFVNRNYARWTEPNVHEELKVSGSIGGLKNPLHHYAFSSIQDQVLTNLRFSKLGSQDLNRKGQKASLFRLIIKPIGKFFETYFIKRGFLDGLPGFIISVNAAHSMFLKYAYLFEVKIRRENSHH